MQEQKEDMSKDYPYSKKRWHEIAKGQFGHDDDVGPELVSHFFSPPVILTRPIRPTMRSHDDKMITNRPMDH